MNEKENPLWNLLFNIALPILVLNKGGHYLGPLMALVVALSFPLAFGAWDFWKKRKTNFFSVLGLLNVLFTGSLALVGLEGFWFAVKEAAFPTLVGLFVLGSAFTTKPFIKTLFLNPQLINLSLLNERIQSLQSGPRVEELFRRCTFLLSSSFALSAVLNFTLAIRIFKPLEPNLEQLQRSHALNQQIAEMTEWSLLVILLPSIVFLMAIFYYLLRGLRQLTGLTTEELIPTSKPDAPKN